MKYPTVVFTNVIRGANKGEAHGGIYLLNLNNYKSECVFSWDNDQISFANRGGDRGLRGICFHKGKMYIAASNELFVFNKQFQIIDSFKNHNLRDCHEISRLGNSIFLTATATNSIIEFDTISGRFVNGYQFRKSPKGRFMIWYDPNYAKLIHKLANDHLNNVFCTPHNIYFSGLHTINLFALNATSRKLSRIVKIPNGTHNVMPYRNGFLMNHTSGNKIRFQNDKKARTFDIIQYPDDQLVFSNKMLEKNDSMARQGFGRGLCTYGDLIIGGSSPATISWHNWRTGEGDTIMVSNEIRNAIHGLEVYPF